MGLSEINFITISKIHKLCWSPDLDCGLCLQIIYIHYNLSVVHI
jgi:hypothetical protein